METIGYIAALIIGISLGMFGGGGSILTMPVLVYLFRITPTLSIAYSFFIVGFTSLVGAFSYSIKGLVNFKVATSFGLSSVATVFLLRKFVLSIIPEVFFRIGSFDVTHSLFVMVAFSALMMAASLSMIKGYRLSPHVRKRHSPGRVVVYGIGIGLITGFLGAGGGFLIIPALVLLMDVPLKHAIGTSLFIIALNSIVGFLADLGQHHFRWDVILIITAIATAGSFIGGLLSSKINAQKLKEAFGWFILLVGVFIMITEIFLKS